jgi:hypothetical protein
VLGKSVAKNLPVILRRLGDWNMLACSILYNPDTGVSDVNRFPTVEVTDLVSDLHDVSCLLNRFTGVARVEEVILRLELFI